MSCSMSSQSWSTSAWILQQLLLVVPFVEGLGLVEALVALEPDQVASGDLGQRLGQLGLPDPGWPLDQDRLVEAVGEKDDLRYAVVGQDSRPSATRQPLLAGSRNSSADHCTGERSTTPFPKVRSHGCAPSDPRRSQRRARSRVGQTHRAADDWGRRVVRETGRGRHRRGGRATEHHGYRALDRTLHRRHRSGIGQARGTALTGSATSAETSSAPTDSTPFPPPRVASSAPVAGDRAWKPGKSTIPLHPAPG